METCPCSESLACRSSSDEKTRLLIGAYRCIVEILDVDHDRMRPCARARRIGAERKRHAFRRGAGDFDRLFRDDSQTLEAGRADHIAVALLVRVHDLQAI